jgi:hypothetical protein
MAWRLHDSVVRGEIDNRQRGTVRGRIWLCGRDEPLELLLTGDCHRDLAGCLLKFENPQPKPGEPIDLNREQSGIVGDMTASGKARVAESPLEEAYARVKQGLPVPEHIGNCLYLEWFSDANGRVVIESTDFDVHVSAGAWQMSEQQQRDRLRANQEAMMRWMEQLGEALEQRREQNSAFEDDKPMDEFEWERAFRESDAITDKYMELQEKYGDSPEAEKRIAREMGWEWVEEFLEAEEKGALPTAASSRQEDIPMREPNALTEGIDWVRDERGWIHHPLQLKMFNVAMEMWHDCKQRGLMGETGDADLHEMIFQAQTTGAKLAGALNGLAYDEDIRQAGFVVAALKRALTHLNNALAGADRVAGKNILPGERLERFRSELHDIRAQILELMNRFRAGQQ